MTRRDWSSKLDRATFRCGVCRLTFTAVPDLVDDDPENELHPFKYFANCKHCGAEHQAQASWERALMVAHQKATGPTTAQGKAAAASNLAGHPTAAESRLTRFNAMKHGMNAQVATYFPARPDGYTFCNQCEVDRGWCASQPACVKRTELFMQAHVAMETRDPKALTSVHANILAAMTSALQMVLQSILGDGVVIKTPRVELFDGHPVAVTYIDAMGQTVQIYDYQANPLFKPLNDMISRMGLSMTELGLTHRAAEEDLGAQMGRLQVGEGQKESLEAFGQRMALATEAMREQLGRAKAKVAADPVLIEHQAQEDK